MSIPVSGRPQGEGARPPDDAPTFADFLAARERYFAHLRADTEARRLEALWRLPAAAAETIRAGRRRG